MWIKQGDAWVKGKKKEGKGERLGVLVHGDNEVNFEEPGIWITASLD